MHTFLWHDYETFGVEPRRDRPAQFAAIRTDAELNEIGEPLMLYCQPPPDYLPDPASCLLTGITPQLCQQRGLPEHEFARRIEAELARPGTIGVGYNTIRFDDEVTRFMLWRNLMDPYAREWQNQCGRWDLLDVVRLAYALRPQGIQWPIDAEGRPSFRLEALTHANGLAHEAAHDALSDVRATIALARLIRERQPRLFDFALSLHKKDGVAAELRLPTLPEVARPFLHVSGMFPAERGCLALMWPLANHPSNRNELLAWDLAHDPSVLAGLGVAELRQRLFTRSAELPEGMMRLPIKSVHLNRSPMVVSNLRTLTPELAARWQIDLEQAARHAEAARALPNMDAIWAEVYDRPQPACDPEQDLYGGFLGHEDRRRLQRLRALSPEELALERAGFDDPRLAELLWRYRARNFPHTLSEAEQQRWQAHCAAVLLDGQGGGLTFDELFARLDSLSEQADERGMAILEALHEWAESIAPEPV
ncbi:exodeoxyribonuclease I [Melaminivora jejuensis]|uniref:exodeoxyribonuclease I n=1 Tax=Melaminivora jejuensis TaxID=1267217 RepID=UPI001AE07326|nr:exodeoxyribonuclease I [Melaminivora jejuensis]UHJ66250.1 exodeoxyribonuclease I [Melaminivora jejuensis]